MRVHITDLIDGDRLKNDVFNPYGLHVLSKGTVLYKQEVSRLMQHHIDYIEIESRNSEPAAAVETRTLESTVTPKWLPNVKPVYQHTVKSIESFFEKALHEGVVDEQAVSDAFNPLLDHLQLERDVVSMLLLLNTTDNYTYQHSVQVGMLSYYLASWMGYSQEDAAFIGKAGFLHDIGKCKIDYEVLNRPDKLTAEEYEEVKLHTVYGYEIINHSMPDSIVAIGALQHHERADGSGYPHGLKGNQIHPMAKIIAVCDIYSAMISARVYQKERDLLFVLKELYKLSFDQLDPSTTHTFIRHMIPNFIGKQVSLSNGDMGVIVMTHPAEFFRPLVKTENRYIDLSIDRSYEITHVYL